MAKKAVKKAVRKVAKKVVRKVAKKAAKKASRNSGSARKAASKKKATPAKKVAKKAATRGGKKAAGSGSSRSSRRVVQKKTASRRTSDSRPAARRKGVRKATIASGVKESGQPRKLGRSRIPVDAPLDLVFQNDMQAREAFVFLGIQSIRELEDFTADELVQRLTSPAKLTVGRIRKILAMNNRCLTDDEEFAVEFQELLSRPRPEA
ncbi:MAG: hypothetical protein ACPGXX_04990 [Planctomycetaceae bacterium]